MYSVDRIVDVTSDAPYIYMIVILKRGWAGYLTEIVIVKKTFGKRLGKILNKSECNIFPLNASRMYAPLPNTYTIHMKISIEPIGGFRLG